MSNGFVGHVMSGNTPVARFEGQQVTPILPEQAPLCFRNGGDLTDWLENRAIDRHRTHVRVLKRVLGIEDASDLGTALYVHGAAVTDDYWVRLDGEELSWDQVRFMTDYLADVALHGRIGDFPQYMLDAPSPELTNAGSFEKCWKLLNDTWAMIKEGTPEEQFSEIFVSMLCTAMGLPAATYHTMGDCVATPDFTEGRMAFEPMRYLVHEDEDYVLNYGILASFGKDLERQYLDILFMDALTVNPDRHTENYGILRDRETGEILSMAPNFDNNLGLISRGYGKDGKLPANPLIRDFHDLLDSQGIEYRYPALPGEQELRGLIRDAAAGLDINQDYVCRMIQANYAQLAGISLEKLKTPLTGPAHTPSVRPMNLGIALEAKAREARRRQQSKDAES